MTTEHREDSIESILQELLSLIEEKKEHTQKEGQSERHYQEVHKRYM